MKASDIAALPIAAGAAVRHRRLFHPTGVLAAGNIERLAPPGEGLPVENGAVVGRISKAVGTPGPLPDAAGLAWRMAPSAFTASSWDVLLVTAGIATIPGVADVANRMLLRPIVSWSDASYSSLLPLRCNDELWWVRAHTVTRIEDRGLSLDTISDQIRTGIEFDIEQAHGTGEFTPLARLTLDKVITADDQDHDDVAFDPVRHTNPDVQIWPDWLRQLREVAYRSSREGRDDE
jgi:hypothetical protein